MRYAAVVAASVAVVGTLVFARDGRSEAAPELAAASAQTVPARQARLQPATGRAAAGRAASQEEFRWAGRLARGQQIEIQGIVGDVRAVAASGDQVEVVGRRSGEYADRVRIEVVESSEGVIVCAIYPSRGDWNGNRGTGNRRDQDPCHNGHNDNDDDDDGGDIDADDARVDFTIRVPAGVKFASRTVAGDVSATGLRSAVDVATVSGNVDVSTTGTARATTVSGDVTATFGETDGEEMEFASVSGNVILRLAGGVGAEVSAHTLTGEIESDFDLRVRGEDEDEDHGGFHIDIGSEASGTIGRGGPELNVNTVSGNIRLERVR